MNDSNSPGNIPENNSILDDAQGLGHGPVLPPLELPLLTAILLLLLLIVFSSLIGTALIYGISAYSEVDFQDFVSGIIEIKTAGERNFTRFIIMLNHLFTFVIPALVFSFLFRKNNWAGELNFGKGSNLTNFLFGGMLILAALPLAQYSFSVFQDAAWLPEWMRSMEDSTEAMVKSLLQVDGIVELLFNVLVIAAIPALGEEFIFRGIIQKQLQFKINPHAAIWLAAILFSAIHLQFEGFVARMILGALLGYLFYFSGSIWVPVFAHFVNNAVQVVVSYFWADELLGTDLNEPEQVSLLAAFVSVVFAGMLWHYLRKHNDKVTIQ